MPVVPYFHQLPPSGTSVVSAVGLAIEALDGVVSPGAKGSGFSTTSLFFRSLGLNEGGWAGFTLRQIITAGTLATAFARPAVMRVFIQPSPTLINQPTDTIASMWVGTQAASGNPYDMADHVQVTFAGQKSLPLVVLGVSQIVKSDWFFNPNFDPTKGLVVGMYFTGTQCNGGDIRDAAGDQWFSNTVGDESGSLIASAGYTRSTPDLAWIPSIEVMNGQWQELEVLEAVRESGAPGGAFQLTPANIPNSDGGWFGYTSRNVLFASALPQNVPKGPAAVRVTLLTAPSLAQQATDQLVQSWIGPAAASGNVYDMASHVQLTWNGQASYPLSGLPLSTAFTSDWVTVLNFDPSQNMVWSAYWLGTQAAAAFVNGATAWGATYYSNAHGDESALTVASAGYSGGAQWDWLLKVEIAPLTGGIITEQLEGVGANLLAQAGPIQVFHDLLGAEQANWQGSTLRTVLSVSDAGGDPFPTAIAKAPFIRIRIKTGVTTANQPTDQIQESWIGMQALTGNAYDMANHMQVTWNGGATTLSLGSLGLAQTVTSDWIRNPISDSTRNVVLSSFFSGTNCVGALATPTGVTRYNTTGNFASALTMAAGLGPNGILDWLQDVEVMLPGGEIVEVRAGLAAQSPEVLEVQGQAATTVTMLDKAPFEYLVGVRGSLGPRLEQLLGVMDAVPLSPLEKLLGVMDGVPLSPLEQLLGVRARPGEPIENLLGVLDGVPGSPLEAITGLTRRSGDQAEYLLSTALRNASVAELLATTAYRARVNAELTANLQTLPWRGNIEQLLSLAGRGGSQFEQLLGARGTPGLRMENLAGILYGAVLRDEFLTGERSGIAGAIEQLLSASGRGGDPIELLLGVGARIGEILEFQGSQAINLSILTQMPLELLASVSTGARMALESLLGAAGRVPLPAEYLLGTIRQNAPRAELVAAAAYAARLADEVLAGARASGGLQDEFLRGVSGVGWRGIIEQLEGVRGLPGIPVENLAGILGRPGLRDEFTANLSTAGWRGYVETLLSSSSRGATAFEQLLAAAWRSPTPLEITSTTTLITALTKLQLELLGFTAVTSLSRVPLEYLTGVAARGSIGAEGTANVRSTLPPIDLETLLGVRRLVGAGAEFVLSVKPQTALRTDQLLGAAGRPTNQLEITANIASVTRVADEYTINLSARAPGLRDEFLITATTTRALRGEWLLGVRGAPGELLELLATTTRVTAKSALPLEVLVTVRGFTIPQFEETGFPPPPPFRIDRFHLKGEFQLVYPLGGKFAPGTQLKGKFQVAFPVGGKVKAP